LALAYAEYLGVKLKIIPLIEFEEIVTAINKGEADISIAGFTSNLARAREVSFSDPYLITTAAGLVTKSVLPPEPEGQLIATKPFKDLFDLLTQTGISMSVKSPSAPQRFLTANFSKFPILSYLSYDLALDALKRNNVNCFVAEGLYIEALLQKYPSLRSNYLPLLNPVSEEHLSVMIPKNDTILVLNLNFFLKEMKRTGRINSLRYKYFSGNGWVKKN
ncbi:MAG: transporter substrate-binding domain-containing protein, partial [Leptospira sp.]|nr:transporter substrate-binding domain-containing protein [Leptospira sp.]